MIRSIGHVIHPYRAENKALDGRRVGFIAQEVREVLPDAVTTVSETFGDTTIADFHVLDTSSLTPMLIAAVKEQQTTISAQQGEIDELKQRLSKLEARSGIKTAGIEFTDYSVLAAILLGVALLFTRSSRRRSSKL